MAVRPRANESMLAEMALMATWLGPAASRMAWWFLEGELGDTAEPAGEKKSGEENKFKYSLYNEHELIIYMDPVCLLCVIALRNRS